MEQRGLFLSALGVGVGVGVGVGLGLASGQTMSKWAGNEGTSSGITPETVEQEMLRQIVDGRDSQVTFDKFPYYLNEQTRALLTSAAYVHLNRAEVSKYTRNLSPASRAIMLSGPAESYQQLLAKALAHYFQAKLLLLDVTDFSLKIQSKHGGGNKPSAFKRSNSELALDRLSGLFGSFSPFSQKEEPKPKGTLARRSSGVDLGTLRRRNSGMDLGSSGLDGSTSAPKLRRNASAANISNHASQGSATNQAPLRRTSSVSAWPFDEKLLVQSLYKVLVYVSKTTPIVLYLRDVDNLFSRSQRICNLFHKMLDKLTGAVLILGSRIVDLDNDYSDVDERITPLFPYNIDIRPPDDETHLVSWKNQLEEDMKMIQVQDNKNHIMEVLAANDLDCDDLGSICIAHTMDLSHYIEEIVVSAVSYHLMNNTDPVYRNGKLVISSKSLSHGLSIFQEGKFGHQDTMKLEAQADLSKEPGKEAAGVSTETKADNSAPANKGGPEIVASVAKPEPVATKTEPAPVKTDADNSVPAKAEVPDNEFEKRIRPEVIPAHEIGVTFADIGAMEEIKESLQELVMLPLRRPDLFVGGLLKPCRGILLFGPPGSGKTMMAKAIAREARASFINVSMSTITSKWFGEDEKNVRALFSLASKVSPTIIFVDEVDSMLGQRKGVGEHEAMRKIKNEFMTHWDGLMSNERILVLAATNRPFDLDEAIIRRFERRILVGLPTPDNREMIMRTLLAKEKVDERVDYKELATMTEGFSGSDLKNFCTTAAYRPVRELIQSERLKDLEKKKRLAEIQNNKQLAEEQKTEAASDAKEENTQGRVIILRPLNMEDFRLAKNQVAASFASEGALMHELKQWNDLYGEGGSRKKEQLSYFL